MNQIVGRKPDGGSFLALVLEPGNLAALRDGRPIKMRLEDLFPQGIPKRLDLRISFSETPVADARALAAVAETVLDERTPITQKKLPHCPECHSTVEQYAVMTDDKSPIALAFCPACGCALGIIAKEAAAVTK